MNENKNKERNVCKWKEECGPEVSKESEMK